MLNGVNGTLQNQNKKYGKQDGARGIRSRCTVNVINEKDARGIGLNKTTWSAGSDCKVKLKFKRNSDENHGVGKRPEEQYGAIKGN